jgi:hypothetical protein
MIKTKNQFLCKEILMQLVFRVFLKV